MNKNSEIVNLVLVRLLLKNTVYNWENNKQRSDIVKGYKHYTSEDWQNFVEEKKDLWLNYSS